ncbi:alpha/beta hydrolase [Amycolatopsis sp. DSM 110486]|uniref:alpha/beta hydrolase n=1 Tax=Amycolatopsis sp. DSM 110486 TaxID=2865832 RepID=UPI001C6A81E9|nr:alpha/beta hydrolase [Amycolatopsis sp. DSM 110486]QYN23720.1 alpha/beta hydrolase [Amycolatopsis sp. DSM 110486]
MRRSRFKLAHAALATLTVLGLGTGLASSASAETFPVSNSQLPLSPGCSFVDTTVPSEVLNHQLVPLPVGSFTAPPELTIHGRLCLPASGAAKTVMLALHGITYTNQYWDSGYQPETYSFVRQMTAAGYGVFAIDRLGYGKSAHPSGALVTLDVQAEVAHQVLQQLRAGEIGGSPFQHVILVGHSYGTATSWLESSIYNDADAVIGTGWGSSIQLDPLVRFFSGFARNPAMIDAKTASAVGLDPTYFTPPAGGRDQDFLYVLSNVDQGMIDYDQNVLRDTVTLGEGSTFINRYNKLSLGAIPSTGQELSLPLSTHTEQIRIPMFLVDGEKDLFFCGPGAAHCASSQALQKEEAQYFAPAACIRAAVTPAAGHDLNLQRNAPDTYRTIRTWADQAVGPDGSQAAAYRSSCQAYSGTNGTSGPAVFGPLAA